jgi:hypothetical protein
VEEIHPFSVGMGINKSTMREDFLQEVDGGWWWWTMKFLE